MLLQFKPFRLQFGDKDVIKMVDHMIFLMKNDPGRFLISEHTLIDKNTNFEYWIANTSDTTSTWLPESAKTKHWGYWQGKRFRRAMYKFIQPLQQNRFDKWSTTYLTKKEAEQIDFIKIYEDHDNARKQSEALQDLWDQYMMLYSLITGKKDK